MKKELLDRGIITPSGEISKDIKYKQPLKKHYSYVLDIAY